MAAGTGTGAIGLRAPVPLVVPRPTALAINVPAVKSKDTKISNMKVGEKTVTSSRPPVEPPPENVMFRASMDVIGTLEPPLGQLDGESVVTQNPPTLTLPEIKSATPARPAATAVSSMTIGPPTEVPIGVSAAKAPVAPVTTPV